jgi:hypothetical protein
LDLRWTVRLLRSVADSAGEPKHRQWLDALLLTLGSCKSRQRNCHEEEGGEAKGMTGSKLLRRPLAGSVLRNEAYCLAWRDFCIDD